MEEDVSIRAVVIGVGVLIAIATITVLMAYYSSAKEVAQVLGPGAEYNVRYRQDIASSLTKNTISGQETINLINYFKGDILVNINISNMKIVGSSDKIAVNNINNTLNENGNLTKFYSIRPKYSFSVTQHENGDVLVISLSGNDVGV